MPLEGKQNLIFRHLVKILIAGNRTAKVGSMQIEVLGQIALGQPTIAGITEGLT